MVRDDWFVTSSLFPHPLLKSHVLSKATNQSLAFPLPQNLYGVCSNTNKSGTLNVTHSASSQLLLAIEQKTGQLE